MLDGRSERLKNMLSLRGSLNFIHSFILFIFTSFICSYPLSFPHTHTLKQGALENKLRHREAEKDLESCVCVCRHPRACKALYTWGSLCCVWTSVWGVCTHRVWVCLGTCGQEFYMPGGAFWGHTRSAWGRLHYQLPLYGCEGKGARVLRLIHFLREARHLRFKV